MIGKRSGIKQLTKLLEMTTDTKKHSAYQILPKSVKELVGQTDIKFYPKYEEERLAYIESVISTKGKTILDIGCNTGYFVFELLDLGAKHITCFEGGDYHSQFVDLATKLLGKEKHIHIVGDYYDFEDGKSQSYDVTLLLNVLHHLGDDYGNQKLTMNEAKQHMLVQLNRMSERTAYLVFQMGFNWKGDITQCLFENGLKAEMIDFIRQGTRNDWEIAAIGIAEGSKEKCKYQHMNDDNVVRRDDLGEFLNRPLFILKSKH
jgi:SAM-dependent methyltransferase